jgi:hypothetical protein
MKGISTTTLVVVFLVTVSAVFSVTYYRVFIEKHYRITYQIPCDPTVHRCFVTICDADDSACTHTPYARITKYARDLYRSCGTTIEGCAQAMVCTPSDELCTYSYCSANTDTDICTDPYHP